MIDVAVVTERQWNAVASSALHQRCAHDLGVDQEAAGRLIAFWGGLHELSKASHGMISDALLRNVLPEHGIELTLVDIIGEAIDGRHGRFAPPYECKV